MNDSSMRDILDAGAAFAGVQNANGGHYAIVPEGYKIESMERFRLYPNRKRAAVSLTDVDSFITYTKRQGSLDSCVIYADTDQVAAKATLVAVIDDHGEDADTARWREHTATFTPAKSVEWTRWLGKDKVTMSQADFATWIEDNIADIVSADNMPSGTDMLQMALNFERTADQKFKQKLNLQGGGVQLEYVDDDDKDTRDRMQVFERFSIGIKVFLGGDPYAIKARLKYRVNSGKLAFWYELIRPDATFAAAVQDVVAKVKDATGFPILMGNPGLK